MNYVLLDASVMVALFDDADYMHETCVERIRPLLPAYRLATSWPCVTEASYLLSPRNHLALLSWLAQGGSELVSAEASDLNIWIEWMQQYSEQGKSLMDLADASLLWLSQQLQTTRILTEDRRDFLRYRLPDGQAFEIVE